MSGRKLFLLFLGMFIRQKHSLWRVKIKKEGGPMGIQALRQAKSRKVRGSRDRKRRNWLYKEYGEGAEVTSVMLLDVGSKLFEDFGSTSKFLIDEARAGRLQELNGGKKRYKLLPQKKKRKAHKKNGDSGGGVSDDKDLGIVTVVPESEYKALRQQIFRFLKERERAGKYFSVAELQSSCDEFGQYQKSAIGVFLASCQTKEQPLFTKSANGYSLTPAGKKAETAFWKAQKLAEEEALRPAKKKSCIPAPLIQKLAPRSGDYNCQLAVWEIATQIIAESPPQYDYVNRYWLKKVLRDRYGWGKVATGRVVYGLIRQGVLVVQRWIELDQSAHGKDRLVPGNKPVEKKGRKGRKIPADSSPPPPTLPSPPTPTPPTSERLEPSSRDYECQLAVWGVFEQLLQSAQQVTRSELKAVLREKYGWDAVPVARVLWGLINKDIVRVDEWAGIEPKAHEDDKLLLGEKPVQKLPSRRQVRKKSDETPPAPPVEPSFDKEKVDTVLSWLKYGVIGINLSQADRQELLRRLVTLLGTEDVEFLKTLLSINK